MESSNKAILTNLFKENNLDVSVLDDFDEISLTDVKKIHDMFVFKSVNKNKPVDENIEKKSPRQSSKSPQKYTDTNVPKVDDSNSDWEGGYMVWRDEQGGTQYCYWMKEKIEEGDAFYRPRNLKKFKFTTNNGREELMKKANEGVWMKTFLEGWSHYVKSAKKEAGFVILLRKAVTIALHQKNNSCIVVKVGEKTSLEDVDCIACVDKNNNTYDGIQTMDLQSFKGKTKQILGFAEEC